MNLFDLIFPEKCINCKKFGDLICSSCFSTISYNEIFTCPGCFRKTLSGLTHQGCSEKAKIDCIIPVVKNTRLANKLAQAYTNGLHPQKLGRFMGELIADNLSQNEAIYTFLRQKPVITFPLGKNREENEQNKKIAYYVAQYLNLKINTEIFSQIKRVENKQKLPKSAILIAISAEKTFTTLKTYSQELKKSGVKHVIGVTFIR